MYGKQNAGIWKFARSKVVLLFLVIFILIIGNATVNMYERYKEANTRADRAEEDLRLLEERKAKLSADLERLQTPRGTEEELRKRFNVAAEGEGVIVIVDPRAVDPGESSEKKISIWQKILTLFK